MFFLFSYKSINTFLIKDKLFADRSTFLGQLYHGFRISPLLTSEWHANIHTLFYLYALCNCCESLCWKIKIFLFYEFLVLGYFQHSNNIRLFYCFQKLLHKVLGCRNQYIQSPEYFQTCKKNCQNELNTSEKIQFKKLFIQKQGRGKAGDSYYQYNGLIFSWKNELYDIIKILKIIINSSPKFISHCDYLETLERS